MVVNPDSPATLSYTAENVKELQVDFQMHDGSGVAEIWSNDKRISAQICILLGGSLTICGKQSAVFLFLII